MIYTLEDLKPGTTVRARLFGGVMTAGTVEDHGDKNGMDLVDLDNGHWCYVHQVVEIVNKTVDNKSQS
jgi:hypothetical protein